MVTSTVPITMYLKLRFESLAENVGMSGCRFDMSKALPSAVESALLPLYGVVGASAISYELVSMTGLPGEVILSVPTKHYRRLWAALTMLTSVQKKPTRCIIVKAAPSLVELSEEGDKSKCRGAAI